MKTNRVLLYLAIILLFSLGACTSPQPAPTPTAQASTAAPTNTQAPDDAIDKGPTATPEPTNTPPPTATPKPTEDPNYLPGTRGALFPIPRINPGRHYYMPTPVPTPENNQYSLMTLSAEDVLNLVQIADKYSYDADIGLPLGQSSYSSHMKLLNISIQEALYHYPNSNYSDEIRWKEVVANIVRRNLAPNVLDWMIAELENGLNSGEYSIDNLIDFLHPKGLGGETAVAENLLGDGKNAYLIYLYSYYDNDGGILLVAINENGGFKLHFISPSYGYIDLERAATDINGNGLPEISVCAYQNSLAVFEWQSDHFEKLTRGQIACRGPHYWFELNPEDFPDIDIFSSSTGSASKKGWRWNGEIYEFIGHFDYYDPFYEAIISLTRLDYLSPSHGIRALEEIINTWEEIDFEEKYYAANLTEKDAWRLNLGFAYLLEDTDKSLAALQSIVDSPGSKDPVPAKLAEVFLDNFSGEREELLPACQAAANVINSDENNYFSIFCQTNVIFQYIVSTYAADDLPALINTISNFSNSPYQTLNISEEQGAFIFLQFNSLPFQSQNLIFLYTQNDAIHWKNIDIYSWYDITTMQISPTTLPGISTPLYRITLDDEEILINIIQKEDDIEIQKLFDFTPINTVNSLTFNENIYFYDFNIEEYYFGSDDFCDFEISIYEQAYLWNQNALEFQKVDILNTLIFEEQNLDLAIQLIEGRIEVVKPLFDESVRRDTECDNTYDTDFLNDSRETYPRLLYLLGLAYEMNSNTGLAARTYYKLWQEAPDSGYALLARAKLGGGQ